MALTSFLFTVGILFGLHPCNISGAQYGDSCVGLSTHCDYEGGWCDPFTDKCSCEGDDAVFSLRTGKCQKENALGSRCDYDNDDCTSLNSRCESDQRCRCQYGFYDTNEKIFPGGECKPQAKLGEMCSSIDTCFMGGTPNSHCNAGVCMCKFGYYPSNGTCVGDKNLHETGCNIDGFDSCMFSAQCVDDTCKCKPGHKQLKPDDKLCSAEVGTFAYCDQDSDCSFDNSECIDNACICRAGFSTYLSSQFGYCKSKRDWVPIGPYIFDVGTNGFSIGWSRPVSFYYECYFVEFTDRNLPDQTLNKTLHVVYPASDFIQSEHPKLEFVSLTPGVEYSVGVMTSASKEACQQKRPPQPTLTDPHNDKLSEMIYAKQRTIPGKPGPLQLDKCDFDNEDGNIRLHWNPPEGQYDGFRVIITSASNTGAMLSAKYSTQPFSEHRITQDEGRFNVSIWSCVDVKDGSTKHVCSERYTTRISPHQQGGCSIQHEKAERLFYGRCLHNFSPVYTIIAQELLVDVCAQCKPLSSNESILDLACSQTTALLRRFKVDKRRASTGLVTLKIRKLKMYRQEPNTQSPKEAVLAGMTGCKCEMLEQSKPKLVAMLRVDGDRTVVTRLVNFTKPVKKGLKKLQQKCDKLAKKSSNQQKPRKSEKKRKPGKSGKQRNQDSVVL